MREGEKKGKIEGKLEGKIEVATRLVEKGFSVKEAADITGLSIGEIKRLKDRK